MELLSPEPSMFSGDPALQDPLLTATLIEGGWMDAACIDGQGWGCSPTLPWLEPPSEAWIQGDSDATSEGVLEPASWWWPSESAVADPGAEPRPMIAICVLPEPELWLEPPPCGDPITGLEDGVVSVSDDGSLEPGGDAGGDDSLAISVDASQESSGDGDQRAWGGVDQEPGLVESQEAGAEDPSISALDDAPDGAMLVEQEPEPGLYELMLYGFAWETQPSIMACEPKPIMIACEPWGVPEAFTFEAVPEGAELAELLVDDGSQEPSGEADQQAWSDGSQGPGCDGTEDAGGKGTASSALSDLSELSDPSDGTVLSELEPELDELMAYSFAGELWFDAESSTTDGVVEGELPSPEPSEVPLAFLFDRSNPLPHWRTFSAPPDPLASSAEELTTAADPLGTNLPQPPSGPAIGSPIPLIPVPLSSEASEASPPLPVAPPAPLSPAAHPATTTASAQPLEPAPIQRPEPSPPPEVTLSLSPEPAAQASQPTAAAASMEPLNAAPSPQALELVLLPFPASGWNPDAMTRSQTAGEGPVSVIPLAAAAGAPAPEQAAAPRQTFDLLPSLLESGGGTVDGAAPIQNAFGDDSFALSELLDQLLGRLRRL